jgi:hypothetical protein
MLREVHSQSRCNRARHVRKAQETWPQAVQIQSDDVKYVHVALWPQESAHTCSSAANLYGYM